MLEGYVYKIIFADGCWYWGTSQYKGHSPECDGYYGSPVTHRYKWKQPFTKIVIKTFDSEEKRLSFETSCIRPDLNNPKCLNEHAGPCFSREIHEKSKGVPRPKGVKEKISQALRGKTLSPEHIQKLRDAERPPRTQDSINKGVESRRGYRHSAETIEKIRESNTGKRHTDSSKAKIAQSVSGFKWFNNGVQSIQSHSHPGEGWIEGRLLEWETPRNRGMKWYHKDGRNKMFKEDPGEGWKVGRLCSKGKKYYNNGTDHVLAHECPGEGWVLGRLKKS